MALEGTLLFILVSTSLTEVLSRAFILEAPKNALIRKFKSVHLEYLLTCPMCLGFWVGASMAAVIDLEIYGLSFFLDYILAGFLCSAFSTVLDRIIYKSDKE